MKESVSNSFIILYQKLNAFTGLMLPSTNLFKFIFVTLLYQFEKHFDKYSEILMIYKACELYFRQVQKTQ